MKLTRIPRLAVLIAGTLLALAPALSAQEAKDAPKRERRAAGADAAKARLDQVATNLNLTAEQKTKVGDALRAQMEKVRELRAAGGTPEENREKVRALRDDLNKKMKEILTAEQYEKWEKGAAQRRGPGGSGGPGKRERKADRN